MNTLTVPIHERDHLRGSPDAPVVLVEYGDFECPYCGAAYAVLKKLEKDLPDTLAVVFRQYPLVNVQDDMLGGLQSGVQGTPTFFINGVHHQGGLAEASLRASILPVAAGTA